MKRFHISISTEKFSDSVRDYSARLGCAPCVISEDRYALWRTDTLNFSISCKEGQAGGVVRHVGFEDDAAMDFTEERDINGIIWEHFSRAGQEAEIDIKFPQAVKQYVL